MCILMPFLPFRIVYFLQIPCEFSHHPGFSPFLPLNETPGGEGLKFPFLFSPSPRSAPFENFVFKLFFFPLGNPRVFPPVLRFLKKPLTIQVHLFQPLSPVFQHKLGPSPPRGSPFFLRATSSDGVPEAEFRLTGAFHFFFFRGGTSFMFVPFPIFDPPW